LVAQYLYIFQKRRETSWTLQERREYLLDCIEISRDATFDEDASLKKSKRFHLEEVYE
jgi:hypothetical protein